MKSLKLAAAQFENKSADKNYNLSVIRRLAEKAALFHGNAIAFHECSITGYTFARHLSRQQMLDLAEYIPEGESIKSILESDWHGRGSIKEWMFHDH